MSGLATLSDRPVPVALGGVLYRASPLRLGDLADLEHWVGLGLPDPLAGLDEAAPDYADRLRAAYDASASWPPGLGSPEADALLYGTAEGQCLFLMTALREERLSADDALAVLGSIADPAEWEALERVAYGADPSPFDAVTRRIDRHIGCPEFTPRRSPSAGTVTWGEAIAQRADGCPLRLEALKRLTLAQWRLLRSGGKPEPRYDPEPADRATRDLVQGLRAAFWAEPKARSRRSPGAPPAADPREAAPPG